MRETVSYSIQQPILPTKLHNHNTYYIYILYLYTQYIFIYFLIVSVDDVIIRNIFKNPYKMIKLIDDYRNYKLDTDIADHTAASQLIIKSPG